MATPIPITIVIADDHPIFRKGLRDVIESEDQFQVVAEAGDGETAYESIFLHKPQVAVLDIEMPTMNGFDVMKKIQLNSIQVSVIILTMFQEESIFNQAMNLGAMGYILKDSAAADIVRGIKTIVHGEYFISPALTTVALKKNQTLDTNLERRLGLHILTSMERQILSMIAQSRSSKVIADEFHVSIRTVEHHRYNISQKLNLSGSYSLLRFALDNKDLL